MSNFKGTHWSEMPNRDEILERIRMSKKANPTRYWLGKKHTQAEKEQISKTKKESPVTIRGKNHHNWKGGVVSEHNKARGSSAYIEWRNAVYRKDKWTWRDCGIHCEVGNIVAHHLVSFADRPELRYLVDNGVVMCRPCHARVHSEERALARTVLVSYITHT